MRRILLLSGILTLFATFAGFVSAAPGLLDRSFGSGFGYVRYADATSAVPDTGSGVAVQADGKIVVAGASGLEAGIAVLRYNADGTLDAGFADQGVFRWKRENEVASAQSIRVLPDGKLYVFGYAGTAARLWLTRLLPDGTPDSTFGSGGTLIVSAEGWVANARRVLIDDRGGLVVIWEALDPSTNKIRISRVTPEGKPDDGYAFGAREVVFDTALFGANTTLPFGAGFDPLGRLLIFASSYNASYNTTLIYRLQRFGYPDATFGTGGMIALQQPNFAFYGRNWTVLTANGTGFVLVEWLPNGMGVRLQKFDTEGQIVTSYGAGGTARFDFAGTGVTPGNAVLRADGSVLVTGSWKPGPQSEVFVLAVSAAGTLDTRLGNQSPQRSYASRDTGNIGPLLGADIAVTPGGGFVVAGTTAGGSTGDDILTMQFDAAGNRVAAFGGNGRVVWNGGSVVAEAALGLWVQAGGRLLTLNRAAEQTQWRRFLADGSVDAAFGSGGKLAVAGDWTGPNVGVFTQGDGKIVLARQQRGPTFTNTTRVTRFRADGTLDSGFAGGGTLNLIDDAQIGPRRPGFAQLPDGRLLLATYGDGGLRLRRLTSNGAPDTSFGAGSGIVFPPLDGQPQVGYTIALQDDGKISIGAATTAITQLPLPQTFVYSDVVARLLPDGLLDPSFGLRGGVVPIQIEAARDPQILRIIPLPDGKTIVAGNIVKLGLRQFFFLRLNANGSVDTDYGDHTDGGDGPGSFIWSDVYQTGLRGALVDAQGRLVIAGDYVLGPGRTTAFVVRFLPNGSIDGAFGGTNRDIFLFDRPELTTTANALALVPNGIVAAGQNGDYGLLFKLEADGSALAPSVSVTEFYNTTLNHYFITADPDEAAAIDGGAAGPGWQRTGRGFRAWSAALGIPPDAQPVCRFYGTPGKGPNSHFYTADPAECDVVRGDPGWRFEGIAFYSIMPIAGGCPVGMQKVFRAYNNRFAQNDSNHRYTTNAAIYQLMQNQGWLPEGVVLCSPTN